MSATERYTAAEAKRLFFLTPADLADLPCERFGGWGAGNMRLYSSDHLQRAAEHKHGEDGLAKKQAAREKREEKKRKREEEAQSFENEMANGGGASPAPMSLEDGQQLGAHRTRVAAGLRANCTWDLLRSKNSPHGAQATVRVDCVEQRHFAQLIGRAADPSLRSLVKKGAWYSASVTLATFFGGAPPAIRGSGGRYGSNGRLGVAPMDGFLVKYSPAQKALSVSAFIAQID